MSCLAAKDDVTLVLPKNPRIYARQLIFAATMIKTIALDCSGLQSISQLLANEAKEADSISLT